MEKPKILSGQALVARGVTKIDASLPAIGLKDVTPNGSWLEQKQIQAALEARKHLIEVERIEKCGTLSHATWRDDLKLAEVTQKSGGYWQYLGHNVGKTLYLRPEEALFLMEINCLLLKHNDINVSLQKAYSLLINEKTTITQYSVYASLSRLGYKVFTHKIPSTNKDESSCHKTSPEKKSDNLDKQLTIDTTVVENSDPPLTDCSVEIVDRLNESNAIDSNIKDVNQSLPSTKQSHSTDDCIINETSKDKSTDRENNCGIFQNDNIRIKTEYNMDIDENEPNEINYFNKNTELTHNYSDANVKTVNIENNKSSVPPKDENKVTTNYGVKVEKESPNSQVAEIAMVVNENAKSKTNKGTQEMINPCDIPLPDGVFPKKRTTDHTARMTKGPIQNIKDESHKVKKGNNETQSNDASKKESTESQNVSCPNVQCTRNLDDHSSIHHTEVHSAASDPVRHLGTPKRQDITSAKKTSLSDALINKRNQIFHNYVTKLKRLTSRQYKPSDFKNIQKLFENIPDLCKKEVITINVPEQEYIPKNIFVNQSSYVLNLNHIKKKSIRSVSVDSAAYNSSDEVNGNHVRRIRSNSSNEFQQNLQLMNNMRVPQRQTLFFRPFYFWRPQNNLNYVQFNMFFQRPCYPNMYIQSRFQYQQRPNHLLRGYSFPNSPNNNPRKRMRNDKITHFQRIKDLVVRLKQLILSGNPHLQNIESLHRLLCAYNTRYKTRLRLTKDFDVVNDETIVETIDLEDDDESKSKRAKVSEDGDTFKENFNLLKELAIKLKDHEAKGKVTTKHKRALSKAIKTFNKSYNADIYINPDFEVIDRRFINLQSDSESECIVRKPKKSGNKKKKLRNPFNILKRRLEKEAGAIPSTSKVDKTKETEIINTDFVDHTKSSYQQQITKTFNENWLPRDNDFGRAEVVHKNVMNSRFMDAVNEDYLINFLKNHFDEFNNWVEAKIAFLQHMEETDIAFQNEHEQVMSAREQVPDCGLKPLIDAEDCSDMPSVLEKLKIIKNNKEMSDKASLNIHFDVYNRNVQNFRKTSPPTPHFRVICIEESSNFPSAAEILSLHSKYEDNVSIVFAIVGLSSISYLQINPIDLPVYVVNNDLD